MLATVAFAMGTPQAGAQASGGMGMLASFMPFILMFVIFWFLLIRPQQKRAKAHREMLEALKRGDKIVTSSGLLGTILEINKDHELFKALQNAWNAHEDLSDYANLMYDQALLIAGFPIEDPTEYSKRLSNVMVKAIR